MKPVQFSFGSGILPFLGNVISKFCARADKTKNSVFLANVSPAQRRFPAPKGKDLSNCGAKCPVLSKNRSGLNKLG